MAEEIATLGIKVLSDDILKATKRLDRLEGQSKKTEKQTKNLSGAFSGLGGIVATIGFGALISDLLRTAASFESMHVSLETVTGSAEKATMAMEGITQFAKNTPFQVSEITDAFIKLKALGIAPTEENLRSFGNTSSAMGKSLNQMIEAVADAATGEFERLKEFGIKASKQGDEVKFTFQGVTTTVKNSSEDITKYLQDIGDTKFAGAMEKQMNTINGKISNLGDSFDAFAVKLIQDNTGGKGILDAAIVAVDFLTDGIDTVRNGVVIALGAFDKFFTGVKFGAEELQASIAVLWTSRDDNIAAFKSIEERKEAELAAIDETVNAYLAGQEKKAVATGGIAEAGETISPVEKKQLELEQIREMEMEAELDKADREQMEMERLSDYNDQKLALEMDYYDRLFNLQAGSQKSALDFSFAIRMQDYKGALKHGSLMLANAAQNSKEAFEIQKGLALANAAVTLPSAVLKSFENGGGYPWGLVPAGLMLAQGLSQISAISSTSFGSRSVSGGSLGGGGMSTSPSAPAASGLPAGSTAVPSGGEQPQRQVKEVSITLNGAGYSKEQTRELIEQINEEVADGAVLRAV